MTSQLGVALAWAAAWRGAEQFTAYGASGAALVANGRRSRRLDEQYEGAAAFHERGRAPARIATVSITVSARVV